MVVAREPDRLLVNGVDLGERWFLTVESTYQLPAQVRDELVETPGRSGGRLPGRPPEYDVAAGKFVVHVGEPERGHLRVVLDELIGLLTGGSEVVLRHSSGGTAREAVIQVQSWSVGDRAPQIYADLEVSYVVPGVFLRALSTTDRSLPAGSSVLPRAGTAPISDAVIRFAGPSSGAHTVSEGVWGTGVTWTGTLTSGQHLFVDPLAMRAWLGASGDWGRPATSQDASGGLVPATAGALALHHTTGWGQGPVTATNRAVDPRLKSLADVTVASSSLTPLPGGGARWAHLDPVSSGIYVRLATDDNAAVDITNPGTEVLQLQATRYEQRNEPGGSRIVTIPPGATQRVAITHPGAGWALLRQTYPAVPEPVNGATVAVLDRLVVGPSASEFEPGWDGDTPDTDDVIYEWTGAPRASTSTVGPRMLTRSTPITASKAATLRFKEAWL